MIFEEQWIELPNYDYYPIKGGRVDLKEDLRVIKRKAKNTVKDVKKVFEKRKSGLLPPKVRTFLDKNGDMIVNDAVVIRCPLESAVKYLLSFISLGTYENAVKQANYDKMFHLALFINGKYVLDKQEVIKFQEGNPMKKDCESMKVDLKGKSITFRELVDKTKSYMGDSKFTNYNSKSNNCQDFILSVLASNDLSSPQLISFIKQDASAVFNRLPSYTEKVATFFTGVGAVANKVIEGENIKVGGDLVEGDYMLIKNGECWTVYNRLNQKIIEPCLPTEEKGTSLIKELVKLDEVKELKDLAVKHREVLRKDTLTKLKNNNNKDKMETWIEFYKKNTKGKKFGSRAEVNAHMKKLSAEYKAMKNKSK